MSIREQTHITRIVVTLMSLVVVSAFLGCRDGGDPASSSGPQLAETVRRSPATSVPTDSAPLLAYEFTDPGAGSCSSTIDADGRVAWRGAGCPADLTMEDALTREEISELVQLVEAAEFFQLEDYYRSPDDC